MGLHSHDLETPTRPPLHAMPTEQNIYHLPAAALIHALHITSRHALRDPALLDLRPPIPGVLLNQDEPLALRHVVLGVALRRVVVQRLDVLELLRAPPGRDRGALLLGPAYRGAAVGVY